MSNMHNVKLHLGSRVLQTRCHKKNCRLILDLSSLPLLVNSVSVLQCTHCNTSAEPNQTLSHVGKIENHSPMELHSTKLAESFPIDVEMDCEVDEISDGDLDYKIKKGVAPQSCEMYFHLNTRTLFKCVSCKKRRGSKRCVKSNIIVGSKTSKPTSSNGCHSEQNGGAT